MASGGHLLAQQKPNVEARIKSLINADLKEICKAYGAAVSGTKIILQKRCIQGECIAARYGSGAVRDVGKSDDRVVRSLRASELPPCPQSCDPSESVTADRPGKEHIANLRSQCSRTWCREATQTDSKSSEQELPITASFQQYPETRATTATDLPTDPTRWRRAVSLEDTMQARHQPDVSSAQMMAH